MASAPAQVRASAEGWAEGWAVPGTDARPAGLTGTELAGADPPRDAS
ncbi:MAG TPA: hypothetical protein VN408_34335 [Actinoplanes sp.]|nr:hypothetical protein [Actinoplanes sp.]